MVSEEDNERGREEVEEDSAGIDEACSEVREVALRGQELEDTSGMEAISPDNGHVSEDVVENEEADGDDAGHDL